MATMESLLNFQHELSKRISKARVNFKKSPRERLNADYIGNRLESLEQLWSEFRQGHKQLVQQSDPKLLNKESYVTGDFYDKFEEEYMDYKGELKHSLLSYKEQGPSGNSDRNSDKSSQVQLPKINIPTFSGKYTEWITFRDLFVSMIHNNSSLDNVQRLQYLKSYLSGEAEQLVRYVQVSDANYAKCWKVIEERYSNKKYLSHCILTRLLSQRNASTESASYLKELIDTSSDCLNALGNLGVDVSTWDIIVIHLLSQKLDPESRKQWELNVTTSVTSDSLPTFNQFKEFLTSRYRALEYISPKYVNKPSTSYAKPFNVEKVSHTKVLHAANVTKILCEFCGEEHKVCFCKKFANQDYEKRRDFVTNKRLCYNCLSGSHGVRFCQTPVNCKICKKRHHSLLHPRCVPTDAKGLGETSGIRDVPDIRYIDNSPTKQATQMVACCAKDRVSNQVLLATALVQVEDKTGQYPVIRALLDQGSQASFVTEAVVQRLGLKKFSVDSIISGLGGDKSSIISKYMVVLKLRSRVDPTFRMELKAYVLSNITTYIPGRRASLEDWGELQHLCLADPAFDTPNQIDVLLGAEVYCQILKEGLLRGPLGFPVAQCTTLGWLISGPVAGSATGNKNITVLHSHFEDNELKRFWEMESEPLLNSKLFTKEEIRCEDFFEATTRRTEDGRYVVKLPFRDEDPACKNGNSREIAIKRLKNLERKLANDLTLKKQYKEVINEYLQLEHMAVVQEPDEKRDQAVYLPHHAVIREDKATTKVRVVFDASCKNNKNVSLNDTLMIGPTLQPDLRHLIMNWRKYPVCIIADIVKMYRMVRVADDDCEYQRIVWRNEPEDEICDYKLLTVTFGTAAAPYLAVKALNQVAIDHKEQYPIAAEKVAKEFYMDDLMTGCQTVEEGKTLIRDMDALLRQGGFILQKWSSNKEELLEDFKQMEREETEENIEKEKNKDIEFKLDNIVKILGLTWNRSRDEFQYSVSLPVISAPVTKRKIISDVARLFDPLGWIAPCVIKAKNFIQRLWIAGTGWDEEPPNDILQDWYIYREELSQLCGFRIPRWLHTNLDDAVVELHGFSDASNMAFAAVVYLRVIDSAGNIQVNLVGAKTRVAPVKQISIPRLELCGAVLLSKLLVEIAGVLNISIDRVRAWTDSTVVLAWINKHASNWKTFVANRVSEIHSTLESSQWSHVGTKDNPADCASRGVRPIELVQHDMWQYGPRYLWEKEIKYTKLKDNDTHEEQSIKVHIGTVDETILEKYSSLTKLVRVVAYCRRLIIKRDVSSTKGRYLNTQELDEALRTCIKLCQAASFTQEIKEIQIQGQVRTKHSRLLSLTPFLDETGVLRSRGRISKSQETESAKHPIILPYQSALSRLIVDEAHRKTLHGEVQLMLNYIRSVYWIIGAKNLVKSHVRKCVTCVRYKAKVHTQLMGSLPSVRVTPARAFYNSGVDYAGPVMLRTAKGRGHKAYKGYVSLFVCMVTKAVHIEVVSDLTSRGFLEAFKRFVARRGHCANLYSDNGTNFVGSSKELKELFDAERSSMIPEIAESLAMQSTTWHFIPARAPNFGGLWEAGIKSTKYHIKRVIGESTLTYEELTTLLSQVEACLNSRPLSVNHEEPGQCSPLTPGHFLIGEPLITVPEISYEHSSLSSLKRWQLTQAMLQNFWRRWSNEYLVHLMHRYKWAYKVPEPQVGDIVLVKEDDLPPCKWLFGRILDKHLGSDGLTRVVSLKCKNSIMKRPTSKLCILPTTD